MDHPRKTAQVEGGETSTTGSEKEIIFELYLLSKNCRWTRLIMVAATRASVRTPCVSQCPGRAGPFPPPGERAHLKEGLHREPGALASRPGSVVDQLCALDQVTLGHCLLIRKMGSSHFHKMILLEANGAFALAILSGWVFPCELCGCLPNTFLVGLTLTPLF